MFLPNLLKYTLINLLHEFQTPEQIKKMQQKKFKKLVTYAEKYSPYYKEIINKNKIDISNCEPEDFPMLTKQTLIERFDDIVTDRQITKKAVTDFILHSQNPLELFLKKYYIIHTSGSSGTIGYFLFTEKELARGLVHFLRFGFPLPGQKFAYIAATRGHFGGVTMASSAKYIPFIYKNVQTFDINMPFDEILSGLQKMQPTSLGGYAFGLRKIAEAQKEGKIHIKPTIIHSGGEPLSDNDKEFIGSVFKAPVINVYATSEHFIMGIGKDKYKGMYLMEDDLIFEIHENYTCTTNLYNYTLPLIRYQMSDKLQTISDSTRTLPFTKIAALVGRKEHVPIFINDIGEEDFISPHLLTEFHVKHLRAFQCHLINKHSFIFKASLEKGLDKKIIEQVKKNIYEKLKQLLYEKKMTKVHFKIEFVDHLWADSKTGKFSLIVKKY